MAREENSSSLTTGSLWSSIWFISWPMLLIMFFQFLIGFIDIYVAGLISPHVQAAVGFSGQLLFLIIIIANAISIGTLALVSRDVGAGNSARAVEISRQSVFFSVITALFISLPGVVFHEAIVRLAGVPAEIRETAGNFLKVFALSLGPNYVLIISNAVFRASGEIKKPLANMFTVCVVNTLLDFALVFGIFPFPKLGYMGIAYATAFSVTAGTALNLFFFSTGRWKSFYKGPWNISVETIKKILGLGWPAAMLQISWNAGTIVLYNILGRLGDAGVTALASFTNGLRTEAVVYLPAFALNMAASVLVGQNLGAGNPARAEKVGWKIAKAGVWLMCLMGLIIFILAEQLSALLTGNPAVLEETTRYLRINMLSEPVMALSAILGGGLQGAGDTRGTMWIVITAMWIIRLPLAYLLALPLGYGATGVWIAMITSMFVQGVLMAMRFHKGRWKELRLD